MNGDKVNEGIFSGDLKKWLKDSQKDDDEKLPSIYWREQKKNQYSQETRKWKEKGNEKEENAGERGQTQGNTVRAWR